MIERQAESVVQLPIEQIRVVNARTRGGKKFREIVTNISRLGLKKPITVAKGGVSGGVQQYDLVCGQGRLEALRALGETTAPAFIVDVSSDELLLMSLAENLARRKHAAVEQLEEIRSLRDRGYTFPQIAEKIDLESSYVRSVHRLVTKGETSLLAAVGSGRIPVSVAVKIAFSSDEEVQRALAEAYESNDLRGNQLVQARRLIESRRRKEAKGTQEPGTELTGSKLMETFRKESDKQRALVQRAKQHELRLVFVVSALKQLFGDPAFIALLKAAGLAKLPQHLAEQIGPLGA